MLTTRLLFLAALCGLTAAAPAAADILGQVQVRGLDGDPRANVESALSLNNLTERQLERLSEARLDYLVRQVPGEVREALEPYGYYEPEIEVDTVERAGRFDVRVQVVPGQPVRVTQRRVAIEGPGSRDLQLALVLRDFEPRVGEVFDHRVYESSKAAVNRALGERGYFDARPAGQRVEILRAERSASIDTAWASGERYVFGETTISEHQFRPGLIEQLVPWNPGEPFLQSRLLEFQQTLPDLDYFAVTDVTPAHWQAEDNIVPIDVSLTPAKRSIYTAGVGYGTDSGAGVRLGLDRRWVNQRGHKWLNLLDWSQRRQLLTSQYRIPSFDRFAGWYTGAFNIRREDVGDIETELVETVFMRSGQIGVWTGSVALHAQRERFRFGDLPREYANLVYPAVRAETSRGDDPLYPTRGWGVMTELRGGTSAIGSDVDFIQAYMQARFVMSFGERTRLLLRGELGTTSTDDFARMPPSLRFFAGGDRSVRGYGFKELGPEMNGFTVGGEHLLVASVELERMFTETWGGAFFVDAGNAFSDWSDFENRVGVGAGVRWRSPVGPVRLDVATGLDDPRQTVRLHINIGPDL